ncbi:MAG: ABC transporter ATP-binding protein [Planctomycetaceae bacterium]|nr:ABC transporter ATP-binding protein [Planctomycetaceae bacterium]
MLRVDDLAFSYGRRSILTDISFEVHPGEIVAVLGPNGSGKSTLLRCLNRILRPHHGSVQLDNRPLARVTAERIASLIAYVPQRIETASLSVFDAVLLGRKPYFTWFAGTNDYAMVETMLDRLELDAMANRPIDRLSGGEAQKVALARALVQEPKLLLLDEPTSALDMKNQVELLTLLREIVRERNIMALLSIHDLNLAIRHADRFLLLREGHLLGDTRRDGLTPNIIEQVYGLAVEIHLSGHNVPYIMELDANHAEYRTNH